MFLTEIIATTVHIKMIFKIKQNAIVLLLLFLYLALNSHNALSNETLQQRLLKVASPDLPHRTDSLSDLLSQISLLNADTEIDALEKLMELTKTETGFDRFLILRHYAKTIDGRNQYWLDSCIRFATRYNLDDYINTLFILKSTFFIKENRYDSAMIYTLKARDESVKRNNVEQIANANHLLGDLYYHTGFYNRAKNYYLKVQSIKGSATVWNDWRRRVIRNNLALIFFEQKKYENGLALLCQSRREIKVVRNKNDSAAMAYIFLWTAEGCFNLKYPTLSKIYIDSALTFFSKLNLTDGQAECLLLKSSITLSEGKIPDTENTLATLYTIIPNVLFVPANKAKLLLLRSEAAELAGDKARALELMKQYAFFNDSLQEGQRTAQILQLQSESEYNTLHNSLKERQREESILLATLSLLAVGLLSLLYQYRKIKIKNHKLVTLILRGRPHTPPPAFVRGIWPAEINKTTPDQKNELTDEALFQKITVLMQGQKVFLQQTCTLETVANTLNSNRTYISRAINTCSGKNFNTYINSLRINESINIMANINLKKLSIEGIAQSSGFRNRTSFISAFQKEVGMLPSTFLGNLKNISRNQSSDERLQDILNS